ncbi:phosphomannomutase/phosphoglucomutase [Haliea sp. E17]|uniref:phosphomannomutase/phosphoglucomutase n=1 Tax=Haliea sp. E17 TaxID=3401576 RepID=UPI003AAC3B94
MLDKLKKKTENAGKQNSSAARGISASGNSIYAVTGVGLGVVALVLILSFAFLLLVREPSIRSSQMAQVSGAYSEQQANNLNAYLSLLLQRLQRAATSSQAASAIASGDATAVGTAAAAMLPYFPDLSELRLVPVGEMGTAELNPGDYGLHNLIELDMVRRAARGEQVLPESFQVGERWVTGLATLVKDSVNPLQRAVMLASLDNSAFETALTAINPDTGAYALEQLYTNRDGSTSTSTIASVGFGQVTKYQSFAVIPDTNWRIVFTPAASLVNELGGSSRSLYVVLAMCLVAMLGGFAIVALRIPKLIELDAFRMLDAADRKTDLTLGIPQLVDVARQLRRATLRAVRSSGPTESASRAQAADPDGFELVDLADAEDLGEVLELDSELSEPADAPDIPRDFPAHIFRAYDIRGNASSELTPELMTRIGGALGTIAGERQLQSLVVGADGRNSSPALKNALIRALMECGRDVIDIGLVPTPVLYFATRHLSAHSGLMITGSHNPKSDNGLKMVLDQETIHAGAIQNLRDRVLQGNFARGKGRLVAENLVPAYIDHIQQDIAIAVPLKIVIDAGNGATSEIAPLLFEELGCEVVRLHCSVDGNFPNHPPDTSNEANLEDLIVRVREEQADFGVAFDGDGDRLAVVTGSGRILRSDVLLMIFAQDVVSRNPGSDVVFDVKCSRNLTELITRCGGRPVLWKTGHAFMKQKMAETGALLGGEFSGHIFFGERWFGFDDGMYAAARLAEILSTQGDSLDTIVDAFPASVNTAEILIPVPDANKLSLMERIVRNADFSGGSVNTLDGIRVDFPEGWGLLRASNTSAALTARFEARGEQELESIMSEFREQIALVDPSLDIKF